MAQANTIDLNQLRRDREVSIRLCELDTLITESEATAIKVKRALVMLYVALALNLTSAGIYLWLN